MENKVSLVTLHQCINEHWEPYEQCYSDLFNSDYFWSWFCKRVKKISKFLTFLLAEREKRGVLLARSQFQSLSNRYNKNAKNQLWEKKRPTVRNKCSDQFRALCISLVWNRSFSPRGLMIWPVFQFGSDRFWRSGLKWLKLTSTKPCPTRIMIILLECACIVSSSQLWIK